MLKNSMFWEVNKHILMVLVIICHYKRFKLHHKTIFCTDYYIFFLPHSRKCLRWRKPIIPVYCGEGVWGVQAQAQPKIQTFFCFCFYSPQLILQRGAKKTKIWRGIQFYFHRAGGGPSAYSYRGFSAHL